MTPELTTQERIEIREYLEVARASLLELADAVDIDRRHHCANNLREYAKRCTALRVKLGKIKGGTV